MTRLSCLSDFLGASLSTTLLYCYWLTQSGILAILSLVSKESKLYHRYRICYNWIPIGFSYKYFINLDKFFIKFQFSSVLILNLRSQLLSWWNSIPTLLSSWLNLRINLKTNTESSRNPTEYDWNSESVSDKNDTGTENAGQKRNKTWSGFSRVEFCLFC